MCVVGIHIIMTSTVVATDVKTCVSCLVISFVRHSRSIPGHSCPRIDIHSFLPSVSLTVAFFISFFHFILRFMLSSRGFPVFTCLTLRTNI